MEHSGKGNPAKSIALLWRRRSDGASTGKSGLTVDSIVEAAIAVADESGMSELSMRAIARRLGVGTMSLYTHIPGKSELIDLMVDTVWGEVSDPVETGDGWRADLEQIAEKYRQLCLRHSWLVYIVETRPVIGPNTIAAWDVLLRPLDEIGLTEVEMDRISSLLGGVVTTSARREIELGNIERVTGETLGNWWMASESLLVRFMDTSSTPVAERVGSVVGEGDLDRGNLRQGFKFQLGLILDGVDLLVKSRRAGT